MYDRKRWLLSPFLLLQRLPSCFGWRALFMLLRKEEGGWVANFFASTQYFFLSSFSFSFPTFSLFIVRGWKRNVCGGEKSCEAVASSSSSSSSDMRVVA